MDELVRKLRAALAKEKKLSFAYLYGSFGKRKDARDIDVAVLLANRGDPFARAEALADKLERAIGRRFPVDVHVLNRATAAFAFEVMSKGRLLWERDRDARLDWEAHALSRYQDIRPMLESHDRRFLGA